MMISSSCSVYFNNIIFQLTQVIKHVKERMFMKDDQMLYQYSEKG